MGFTLNIKEFYRQLGKLLYAVAIRSTNVGHLEIQRLQELVSKMLVPIDLARETLDVDNGLDVVFGFDECISYPVTMQEACDSFIKFIDMHVLEIDPILIEKSVKAIDTIVADFGYHTPGDRALINTLKNEIAAIADIY